MTPKHVLSAIFLLARAADFGTTYAILNTFPLHATEANPLAALALEQWGYAGMAALMLATSLVGVGVMWYACHKQPGAGRKGLIAICLIAVGIVAHNVLIIGYCFLNF